MPGPPPKPTALKILSGNPGQRPLNENEPKPKVVCPAPPRHLDATGKKAWKRAAKVLSETKVITESDIEALELYANAYSRYRWATDQLNKNASLALCETPQGFKVQSALIQVSNKQAEILRRMLIEFGMTPASRSRIVAVEKTRPKKQTFSSL